MKRAKNNPLTPIGFFIWSYVPFKSLKKGDTVFKTIYSKNGTITKECSVRAVFKNIRKTNIVLRDRESLFGMEITGSKTINMRHCPLKPHLKDNGLKNYIEKLILERINVHNKCRDIIDSKHSIEKDNVNHPEHYTWLKEKCGIEVLDITRHLDFSLGNAVKYILRAGKKDADKIVEDLKKAVFYINDKIAQIEGKYDQNR